jgi:fatty acid amide hydrolase 2
MGKSILDLDATQLAIKIKSGEITSLSATEHYIEQIKKINPKVNGLVENRFEAAIAEALQCDERLREGTAKGRLFGVPISVKESFHVKGMKTTGGIRTRNKIEEENADAVAKLLAEGAIILGKTNTATLCYTYESVNRIRLTYRSFK